MRHVLYFWGMWWSQFECISPIQSATAVQWATAVATTARENQWSLMWTSWEPKTRQPIRPVWMGEQPSRMCTLITLIYWHVLDVGSDWLPRSHLLMLPSIILFFSESRFLVWVSPRSARTFTTLRSQGWNQTCLRKRRHRFSWEYRFLSHC